MRNKRKITRLRPLMMSEGEKSYCQSVRICKGMLWKCKTNLTTRVFLRLASQAGVECPYQNETHHYVTHFDMGNRLCASTRSPLGNWPNMQNKEAFLNCILCLPVSALRYLCTLTGSKHLGQAESYRCCTIGSILCDWHINSVKKMSWDLPFFNMFFFNIILTSQISIFY